MTARAHCPACGQDARTPQANRDFPFCSERCRLADLGQWFAGRYAIPEEEPEPVPPEAPPAQRQ